ncbi:DFP-domain-containing protein [Cryphonectria parasitica EP155]|uniref:DFP-domain-containing protein n=1 Tax=Cryphonectria parasitica (strain ATCC 38755 / EP155) TaxID=660469 RepID=A0A9P4Y201_CRYP1|nr:DFP-domain-containing protein [Cryphonectria parasitica EP155]KAF3765071.1 DFP-domain-containing protein [Cryphonectria parasitica EP155]
MAPSAEATPAAVEDQYFSSNPPPKALSEHIAQARDFIDFHAAAKRRVVLVTSGGTTVPLEKQTVRFIDNFSAGTRGATSAEYFLENGYAVVFLHRQFSLLPYSRHYSHATNCFLDFLDEGPGGTVVAKPEFGESMLNVLRKYQTATSKNLLLTVPFVTIGDYLHELRAIARLMHRLGPDGLLYLAAAASDFFLPQDRMAEHKIQSTDAADGVKKASSSLKTSPTLSGGGGNDEEFDNFDSTTKVPRSKRLIVDLDPVPKFLKNLVDGWAPQCMIVSFKLETDPEILVHKAKTALERYSHNLVIGNLLSTRKWEVVFVAPGRPDKWIRTPGIETKQDLHPPPEDKPLDPALLPEGDPDVELESLIIPALEELHTAHIQEAGLKSAGNGNAETETV